MPRRIVLALCCLLACRPLPSTTPEGVAAPAPAAAPAIDPLRKRLDALDRRVERELERLDVTGAALVIVQGDQVIHVRGFGRRDVEQEAPVTADTLFAIGSTTKAFTAMLVMMAVEAGKISLDDHPRKCVPAFKLRDPDADARITVRDLLTHSSGLMGTDLAWITGQLTSDELVALLGEAEPTAPLRTSFQYQNVMYLAAGMCAARALGGDYEKLLRARILAPIGMGTATLSVTRMQQRPDFARGHHRQSDRQVRGIPMRNLDAIAPAGGINASAAMLGGWLRLLLAGGSFDGKQLIGTAAFEQLLAPQFDAGPELQYTLGWLRSRWRNDAQLSHTGGIDGFSTLVAMLPARRLGFALLTNVDNADIHGLVTREVFGLLDEEPPEHAPTLADPDALVGSYGLLGGFKVELVRHGEGLAMRVPQQPPYPLELERGLRFRLGSPAPAGFFAELRDVAGKRELFLQQPFGDLHLAKLDAAELAAAAHASAPPELRELIGVYRVSGQTTEIELAELEGGVSMVVPGQPPARLVAGAPDHFTLAGLPAGFSLAVQRDGKRKLSGLSLRQPGATLELALVGSTAPPAIGIDRLLARRAAAHGSKALAKLGSLRMSSELVMVHQGLRGTSVVVRAAGDRWTEDVRLLAFGREIGRVRNGYDGRAGWERISFSAPAPIDPYTAHALALESIFDPFAADVSRYASATITRSAVVDSTPVVVARFTTDWGATIVDSYDAKSWLLVRRELELPIDVDGQKLHETRRYSDWRRIRGAMIPHRVETESVQGKVVATVTAVELGLAVDANAFAPPGD